MLSLKEALLYTFVMGAVVFLCRSFPFILLRGRENKGGKALSAFLNLVEKAAPPIAMTVLAFNAVTAPVLEKFRLGIPVSAIPVLAASVFTALAHIWKRNSLISIIGGTVLYMVLTKMVT
jgi:branched-subunit amino acid transport protein AzlD